MTKRIRKSVVAGQIGLLVLGAFMLVVSHGVWETMAAAKWYYSGPAPGLFLVLGIVFVIAAVVLFSVARYEVNPTEMAT